MQMTKVFVYTKLPEEQFFNFISGKKESEVTKYPEVFERRYAGEVLERFEEMNLRDNQEVWEEFLISTMYGVLNRIEYNTDQLDEFAIKLRGLENQTDLEKFIAEIYDLLSSRNGTNIGSLLDKTKINQDALTFETKQKMLAYINPNYIGLDSYSDKSYVEYNMFLLKKNYQAVAYFLQSFKEEELELLDRKEKQLFVTLSAITQAILKLKKAEFFNDFHFKLFSKATSYCKKEIGKIKEKENLEDVAKILGFDNEYDFIAFHTNMTTLKTFKSWSEPAMDRSGEFIDNTIIKLEHSIYSDEMMILTTFITKKLNGEDDNYRSRLRINLTSHALMYRLQNETYSEEILKDLILFYLKHKKERNGNSSISMSLDGLNNNVAINMLKALDELPEEEKKEINLHGFLQLFTKTSKETKEDYEFSVEVFNKFYALDNSKFIEELNKYNFLSRNIFNFFIESEFEIEGYCLSDLSVLRLLNQDLMLQAFAKTENIVTIFKGETDLEEEEKIVLSQYLSVENTIKNKNNDAESIHKYVESLFEYYSLNRDLRSYVVDVYNALISYREEDSFNELKNNVLDLIKLLYKEETIPYHFRQQLKQYFIENTEEAISYIDNKINFFEYYSFSESQLETTMFELNKIKDFISEPSVKRALNNRLARNIERDMRTEHFDVLFNTVIKRVNSFAQFGEEEMSVINQAIKTKISKVIPVFENEDLMNFILENK